APALKRGGGRRHLIPEAPMGTSGRLLALGFGNFIIGTGTLIVPGMLPALARGLDVTMPVAGGLITAFAVTIAVSAPILAGAPSRIDRRHLLVATQLYFAAGHVAAACCSGFGAMMGVRAVTSLAAGLYTAQAAASASLLVPADSRGRALAFVFLGWAIASVVGLPLGSYVGSTIGWRAGFLLVAGGAFASALALWVALPSELRVKPIDRAMWRSLLGHRRILMVVGVTVLLGAAQFTLFSYVVPAMKT